ncbi:hypothetical protein ACFVT5_02330 [Streptomyces sp. NPDC058001]|uniref:hypothetical protein n=1 Tax=Streptomyces sp. NPDC058001 TaxID=3346300 RepID=UPI0036EF996D
MTPVRGRWLRRGLAVPLAALALAGCGIRSTEVPTDFGPAPSRAPCELSAPDLSAQSAGGIAVQVYLLCSSQLVTVDRTVELPKGATTAGDRVQVAQALLGELEQEPSTPEKQAGYTTDVRGGMTVTGPRAGDPDDALRLGIPPEDLSAFALAQIVCTLANSAAAENGTVTLGGPNTEPLRRYDCPPELRSRPGTTEPPSTVVTG